MIAGALVAGAVGLGLAGAPVRASTPAAADAPFSFVVLGHLRGDQKGPNAKLGELLAEVRALRPAFVVLTGDMIYGDTHLPVADTASLRRQWDHLDSALATLGVPVYRVPGNHDISDLPSRDTYIARYGRPPQAVSHGQSRLLLLSSAWIPEDGDTRKHQYIRGKDLDSAQVSWLRAELAQPGFQHTFVFMAHLLWWEPAVGPWWREVHPLLAAAKVSGVFTGDYGPLKFSTTERDGVRYWQCSIEDNVSVGIQRARLASRILSSQFDNYLQVHVDGPTARVEVHTVAEVSSGQFTSERFAAVSTPLPPRTEPAWRRVWNLVGSPKRLAALGVGLLLVFGAGWVAGRRR